jgi:hypothetical protein
MTDYNYPRFSSDLYDMTEFSGPRLGQPMPVCRVFSMDGVAVDLSTLPGPYVLELGSQTCSIFVARLAAMNELAAANPHVPFYVLYVREAHPGERRGPHRSLDEKLNAAVGLKRREPESRTVLVDDVAGEVHQRLGSLPNSVYVVGPDGTVQWRSDWSDPAALAEVLGGRADEDCVKKERRPPGYPPLGPMLRALGRGGLIASNHIPADSSHGASIFMPRSAGEAVSGGPC